MSYDNLIQEAAAFYQIDPDWIEAVARIESALVPNPTPRWEAHLGEHSYGIGQFLPSTILWMLRTPELFPLPVEVRESLRLATEQLPLQGEKALNVVLQEPEVGLGLIGAYLTYLLRRYNGNIVDAVAAYNAGSVRKTENGNYVNQWHVDKFLKTLDDIRGV